MKNTNELTAPQKVVTDILHKEGKPQVVIAKKGDRPDDRDLDRKLSIRKTFSGESAQAEAKT